MEMIITKRIPKNKFDPLYKYSKVNFIGRNFLIHPDILLFNTYKYSQRDLSIYYALSALRSISDYKATKKDNTRSHQITGRTRNNKRK
jgi:hypothetical protein